MRHLLSPKLIVCALATVLVASGRADEFAEKSRPIFEKNSRAVITVEVVQKVSNPNSRSSASKEGKSDLTGMVVDPSGLTVIALSSADPSDLYHRMVEDYKAEVEVSEVKLLLDDGTELPAEIVLRDKDLDLAFIRPKTKPATPMTAIDLHKSGPAQVLDPIVTLNRLKRAAGRAFSASEERISAVVQKPRTFYIPDSGVTETALGCPAFTLDGNLLGLFVMRSVSAQGAGSTRDCITGIILPAEDILKGASQAPEAKGDDDKKDAAAPATPTAPATNAAPAK